MERLVYLALAIACVVVIALGYALDSPLGVLAGLLGLACSLIFLVGVIEHPHR